MPELPEVEVVKNILLSKILNQKILNVKVFWPKIIKNVSSEKFINDLKNQTFKNIERKGKHLIFYLNGFVLCSHLRMEGRYLVVDNNFDFEKISNLLILFYLNNNKILIYRDTRKFGTFFLYPLDKEKSFLANKPLINVGIDANSLNLKSEYLSKKFSKKRLPIKTALLDQSIISGIGNIYASEILFLARIHPTIPAYQLNQKELKDIIHFSREVLNHSIALGGSTVSTFEPAQDIHGRFQHELFVYRRNGKNCKICNTTIQKIVQNQRSTFFCPKCQALQNHKNND
ncbi:bifunctional DNA-formamidopyrimidine glycosylase/DNA-(apurinic or apyrimidinic site) lyase [Mycoplasma sp. SG1]|uniref:bifunctional DNA-formamidopyrimidine glycosylase/DNA-(apurinic or apyrimidinic site) lyase n=1 Tax=Mycoplasma sp. SG1 TaxID=2810348 RepID=UPI0020242E9D|nr:bifunctional DNA-formamidopyrimidine glycosylase/DNA-(apurinic or apyrimidinic site) lyase [Mycoplasma sp. SG1]URM52796.1 bifunctional DNA-formamidopyrimidine glycosylase/DNA-(apurinic or apyrimidinic site) lyase [Mycoplasma sp. SG1]